MIQRLIWLSTVIVIFTIAVLSVNTREVITEERDIKLLSENYNPYQKLYDEMLYPTVRIESVSGIGSGVVINRPEESRDSASLRRGAEEAEKSIYILTASHVVGNQSVVTVTLYSQNIITSLSASVVITDTIKDLALLRTQINADLQDIIHKAKLAPKNYKPFIFTEVWAVGCSLGLNPRPSFGYLCALCDLSGDSKYWEVSSPILPGNSGGPVFSADTHELIGIAVWVKVYHGQLVTTMAGIVPIQKIYEFLESIEFKSPKGVQK